MFTLVLCVCFFKQKTAYEMRISDWSSDVCSSDLRPLPDGHIAAGAVAETFDALVSCLTDTRIETDLDDILWGVVNVFHRAGERIERELDDNERAQKRLQREQDGSEVKSVELERKIAEGITLIERREVMEFFRETGADLFRIHLD